MGNQHFRIVLLLFVIACLFIGCRSEAIQPDESAIITIPAKTTGIPPTATRGLTQTMTLLPESTATLRPTATKTFTRTPLPTPTDSSFNQYGPIAYVYDEDVYLMDASVPSSEKLFSHPEASNYIAFTDGLSWSPDGQSIAYNSQINPDVFVYSRIDGKIKNITNLPDNFEQQPDWSPDGRQIVFTGDIDRNKTGKDGIYVMNADGTQITRLIDCEIRCLHPDWSPSGRLIAYVAQIDGYTFDLYVMKSDGTNPVQFAHGGFNLYPAWSPDGETLAFTREVNDGQRFIYRVNADGSGMKAITDNSVYPRQFSWSSDGNYIVFDDFANGPVGLKIVDVNSGEIHSLTSGGAYYAPEWLWLQQDGIDSGDIIPLPDCTNGWSRLTAGAIARVMGNPGDPANNVRSEPMKGDNIIGKLPPATLMTLVEGPVCASGLVFWKVQSDAITAGIGWTAEGDGINYYLEPVEEP